MEIKHTTTQFRIYAEAHTSYQFRALGYFGMQRISRPDGSFYCEDFFPTKEQAVKHLRECCVAYYDDDMRRFEENMSYIDRFSNLEIDGVTAQIEEVEI